MGRSRLLLIIVRPGRGHGCRGANAPDTRRVLGHLPKAHLLAIAADAAPAQVDGGWGGDGLTGCCDCRKGEEQACNFPHATASRVEHGPRGGGGSVVVYVAEEDKEGGSSLSECVRSHVVQDAVWESKGEEGRGRRLNRGGQCMLPKAKKTTRKRRNRRTQPSYSPVEGPGHNFGAEIWCFSHMDEGFWMRGKYFEGLLPAVVG